MNHTLIQKPTGHPQESKRITKLSFKMRILQDERILIRAASMSDPTINDFMDLISDAEYIDLSSESTISGINYLEDNGHIDLGRATEILYNNIEEGEKTL